LYLTKKGVEYIYISPHVNNRKENGSINLMNISSTVITQKQKRHENHGFAYISDRDNKQDQSHMLNPFFARKRTSNFPVNVQLTSF
jgi:hypothetical protein